MPTTGRNGPVESAKPFPSRTWPSAETRLAETLNGPPTQDTTAADPSKTTCGENFVPGAVEMASPAGSTTVPSGATLAPYTPVRSGSRSSVQATSQSVPTRATEGVNATAGAVDTVMLAGSRTWPSALTRVACTTPLVS